MQLANPSIRYEDIDYNVNRRVKIDKLHAKNKKRKHHKLNIFFFMRATLLLLGVFSVLSLIVFRYAMISEVKYNIYGLKNEINELNITIEELNTQLNSGIVLDNIEAQAIRELGMQYPKDEQIVYLNSHWNYSLGNNDTVVIDSEKPNNLIDERTLDVVKSVAVKLDDVMNN